MERRTRASVWCGKPVGYHALFSLTFTLRRARSRLAAATCCDGVPRRPSLCGRGAAGWGRHLAGAPQLLRPAVGATAARSTPSRRPGVRQGARPRGESARSRGRPAAARAHADTPSTPSRLPPPLPGAALRATGVAASAHECRYASARAASPPRTGPQPLTHSSPPPNHPPLPHLGCRPQGQTTGGCGGCGTTTAAARGVQLMGGNRGDARLEAPPTRSRARRGGGVVAAEPRGSGGRLKPSSGDVARSWCRGCRCQACDATWRRGGGGLPRK